MSAQNVPDGLVRDLVSEVGKCTGDPVRTPAGILARQLNNQRLHFGVNPRPARVRATLRTIELLRDQFSEPAEDRLGFGDLGDFRQSLQPQPLADFGQRGPLLIREPQPSWCVCPEDPVLRDKIFDLKQQLLIDQPRHVRQQTGHLTAFHPVCIFSGRPLETASGFFDPTRRRNTISAGVWARPLVGL